MQSTYRIQADWDPEAGVWCTTSDDVPGLATEAATIESLTKKPRVMIPELLEATHANHVMPGVNGAKARRIRV